MRDDGLSQSPTPEASLIVGLQECKEGAMSIVNCTVGDTRLDRQHRQYHTKELIG